MDNNKRHSIYNDNETHISYMQLYFRLAHACIKNMILMLFQLLHQS